jgi:hypothetical protein
LESGPIARNVAWQELDHVLYRDIAEEGFATQAEALDDWVSQLRARFGDRPVAICLEQSRGSLLYALMKYENLTLFPINPKQLAKYRQAFSPSGPKDDPTDAQLLCEFVRQHHARRRASPPPLPFSRMRVGSYAMWGRAGQTVAPARS